MLISFLARSSIVILGLVGAVYTAHAQPSESSQALAAARAMADQAKALAKSQRDASEERSEERNKNDPTWNTRLESAKKIMEHPAVHKALLRSLGVSIVRCHREVVGYPDLATEKHSRISQKLTEQISGGPPLGQLVAPGTVAFQESVNKRADWIATWHSEETLVLGVQMLGNSAGQPIVVAWAASYFNLNVSCLGKVNTWETTPEDRIYMEVKRQLGF